MVDDQLLSDRGLKNYWGYNTLSFFAPAGRYSSMGRTGEQVAEFKSMVKALHAANIEVILDVVYNHTAEGNHLGPMLSLKGIDNRSYYRVVGDSPRYYMDYTGCGNSLNMRHPQTLKLVMDSLRYWVTEMHVDGFRFDLASTLARELHDVDRLSAFFDIIHQDPVLSTTKLIAEPWDVGEGGYQVGNFPDLWTEWNGRYRDAVRRYWKGDQAVAAELGFRLTGSSDLYEVSGRRPHASINFVTAHDGFTLHDLVSYNNKHNEANGEQNRDGSDNNDSWNHGVEGETDDPAILELRERQKRNFLTTLMVSQGVPMICSGDEMGKTQGGNNNAYCQDNELSWLDWSLDERRRALLEFTQRIIALRNEQPVLRRRRFFSGGYVRGSGLKDIVWFRPDGQELTGEDWNRPQARSIGMLLGGDAIPTLDEQGEQIIGDTLLVLTNAYHEPLDFVLPAIEWGESWEILIDTRTADQVDNRLPAEAGTKYTLLERSMVVMRLRERASYVGGPPVEAAT
jgi:glycogen operon protein